MSQKEVEIDKSDEQNEAGETGSNAGTEAKAPEETAPDPAAGVDPEAPVEDDPAPPTSGEMAELRKKAAQADEYWDKLLRQAAEFENFKKRAARDRQDAIRYANEALMECLLPVVDNFEMALSAANSSEESSVDSLKTGINMICTQLKNVLRDHGIEEVEAVGQAFDHNLHEAVQEEVSGEVPAGHVLKQLRRGYKLRDRLVRPASVVVAKREEGDGKSAGEAKDDSSETNATDSGDSGDDRRDA